ncbi:hypothetical protein LIER_30913 [Lithospermum erythrorhizon]|uniref:Uncharacterized protein n=1 Tax=Lithospermum erythrorhizon TaxID=34254 RepID=A0AAV3RQA7_LITER
MVENGLDSRMMEDGLERGITRAGPVCRVSTRSSSIFRSIYCFYFEELHSADKESDAPSDNPIRDFQNSLSQGVSFSLAILIRLLRSRVGRKARTSIEDGGIISNGIGSSGSIGD